MKRVFTFDKKIVKFWQGSQCQELKVDEVVTHVAVRKDGFLNLGNLHDIAM